MISESIGRFFLTRLSSHVIRKRKKGKSNGICNSISNIPSEITKIFHVRILRFPSLHIQSSGQFPDLLIGFRQKRESNGVNNSLKLGIKLSKVGMKHYFSRFPSSAVFELPI